MTTLNDNVDLLEKEYSKNSATRTSSAYMFNTNNNNISFAGISFPVLSIKTEYKNNFGVHKLLDTDGDYMQRTGQSSLVFTVSAAFDNTITPKNGEKWKAGELYPKTFNELHDKLNNSTGDIFTHPYLGNVLCVCTGWNVDISSQKLSSPTVDITFVQTILDPYKSALVPTTFSINLAAISLDDALETARTKLGKNYKKWRKDNQRNLNTLGNAIDNINRFSRQASGFVSMAAYRGANLLGVVSSLAQSANIAYNAINSINDVSFEKLKRTIRNVQSAAQTQKDFLTGNDFLKSHLEYNLECDMSPSLLCQRTKNTISELIFLNGRKIVTPLIKQGTLIKYYGYLNSVNSPRIG